MVFKLACLLLLTEIPVELWEEPWTALGIEFGEATPPKIELQAPPSALATLAQKTITFYRAYLTQTTGPRSHFRPSSSLYMLQAIQNHGFITGYILGCDRLLRENSESWVYRAIEEDGRHFKSDN